MDELQLGSCIKNMDREVQFQNHLCLKTCGVMVGKVCTKGCMTNYSPVPGMVLFKNLILDNISVDAVVINDGDTLASLLYLH